MKLKQAPDDFLVEELTDIQPGKVGDHSLYRLDKSDWTTPDALSAIGKRWDIDPHRVSFGGLKDKHARTTQFLSIFHGPERDATHNTIHVRYLGRIERPYTSDDIRANRFAITLRDVSLSRRDDIEERLAGLSALGVPNYFDDQRFGSVSGPGGEFIGRLLVRGRFDDALKLALTGPYAHDNAVMKREKQILLQHWGNWGKCRDLLPRGHARDLMGFLCNRPGDMKGTVVRLHPELRGLYLAAYQSHIWNRMLSLWITQHTEPAQRSAMNLRLGPVPIPLAMNEVDRREYDRMQLPLPSARWKPDERLPLVEAVLAEEGFPLRDMQVRGVRELFFSRGERPARIEVNALSHSWSDDAGLDLTLRFELPRGSYATLVVKAATGDVQASRPA